MHELSYEQCLNVSGGNAHSANTTVSANVGGVTVSHTGSLTQSVSSLASNVASLASDLAQAAASYVGGYFKGAIQEA